MSCNVGAQRRELGTGRTRGILCFCSPTPAVRRRDWQQELECSSAQDFCCVHCRGEQRVRRVPSLVSAMQVWDLNYFHFLFEVKQAAATTRCHSALAHTHMQTLHEPAACS